jgi:hypothetical protein
MTCSVKIKTPIGVPLLRKRVPPRPVWVNVYQIGVGDAWDTREEAEEWGRGAFYRIKITPKVCP